MELHFPIAFKKMSGTGNDFVVIDNREELVPAAYHSEFTRRVCRRKFSIGADGVIFIRDSDKAEFGWDFYNADGSIAEMCGNGARCAARFACIEGITDKKTSFETLAGIIEAETGETGDIVKLKMTRPEDFRLELSVKLDGVEYPVTYVNSGVPHAVIFVDRDDVPVKKWGRKVRFHQLFEPDGANVNFIREIGPNKIKVRTYERGVEDETMACGTGAVASAIYGGLLKGMESPVEVETSGGDLLTIYFELYDGPVVDNVYLEGPARVIYTGNITAEALL
ncbi:MAG: diaminopimelate epimerase [Desulfobacterales bacterium]|nr:MAG: diaminopimelate epimerase [Desulfobacterales bacterium]